MIIEINLALTLAVTTTASIIMAIAMLRQVTTLKCRRLHLWIGWIMTNLESCRRFYIRSRRPRRIILIRHAESEGNVDKGVYTSTPDHALKITELGKRQAAAAGRDLRNLIGDESVYFIISPYTRTRMTYDIIREALGRDRAFAVKEDPRLRELDFGNFQDLDTMSETMETRKAYGRFWFRFMNGESGADVYDRATAFWESVFRSMDHTRGPRFDNYVIITHGLMMRLILMRYFQWKVEFFERVWNPDNCKNWVMERDEWGSYRVVTEILDRPKWAMMESSAPDSLEGKTVGNEPGDDLGAEKKAETGTRKGTWDPPETVTEGNLACSAATSTQRENQDVAVEHWKPETDANTSDADTEVGPKKGRGRPQGRIRVGGTPGDDPTGSAEWLISSWEEDEHGREEVRRGKVPKGNCLGGVCADAGDKLEEGGGSVHTKRDGADDGCTPTTSGSSLQLRNGGCAPGEEGCGRDEDL